MQTSGGRLAVASIASVRRPGIRQSACSSVLGGCFLWRCDFLRPLLGFRVGSGEACGAAQGLADHPWEPMLVPRLPFSFSAWAHLPAVVRQGCSRGRCGGCSRGVPWRWVSLGSRWRCGSAQHCVPCPPALPAWKKRRRRAF